MYFCKGMTCCKPDRVEAGMECDFPGIVECAFSAMLMYRDSPPNLVKLFRELTRALPAYGIAQAARAAGVLDQYLEFAARICAERPTRTERRSFVADIEQGLVPDEKTHFLELHAAHWHQLRGEPLHGVTK